MKQTIKHINNEERKSIPSRIDNNTPNLHQKKTTTLLERTKSKMTPPKKYIKINGVMKMNPAYKAWKDGQVAQTTGVVPVAAAMPTNANALPVVSSMEDHMKLNEDLNANIPLAESTDATIEMMQEPEISLEAGMQPDEMVDQLGSVLEKYEVPMGLMNKRKLSI